MAGKDDKNDKGTPPATPDYVSKAELDEIKKQNAELQKKLGEQADQLGQFSEYVTGTSAILNAIAADENLTKAVRDKVKGVPGGEPPKGDDKGNPPTVPQGQDDKVVKQVDNLTSLNRTQIIRKFEEKSGILSLPPEKQAEERKNIGRYLADFGWRYDDIPLEVLETSLDKAYVGTHAEKLREEGKLEGIAAMRTNELGSIGGFAGGAPASSDQQAKLTEKQKEWLKKTGVKDVEGAEKLYVNRENEKETAPEDRKE